MEVLLPIILFVVSALSYQLGKQKRKIKALEEVLSNYATEGEKELIANSTQTDYKRNTQAIYLTISFIVILVVVAVIIALFRS